MIAPSTPEQIAAGFSSAANQLTSPLLTSTRELGNYFWSGSGVNSVLSETVYLDHAGTAAAFGAIPVAVNANGGTGAHPWNSVRVYTDQQGTPRRLVDQSLNLFGKWDSDPFGVGAWNYNPAGNGAIYIDQRFPGQSSDDAFGTYFNTARNYYPNIGRYLQSDPIGLAGAPSTAVNTYSYVGSNPANEIDPTGLETQLWSRPTNITGPFSPINQFGVSHYWLKTDQYESGMGGPASPIPGQGVPDLPFTPVQTVNHAGQSNSPGATQVPIPFNVDEQCVNKLISPGQPLGYFVPLVNDCKSFSESVLRQCETPVRPVPTIMCSAIGGPGCNQT